MYSQSVHLFCSCLPNKYIFFFNARRMQSYTVSHYIKKTNHREHKYNKYTITNYAKCVLNVLPSCCLCNTNLKYLLIIFNKDCGQSTLKGHFEQEDDYCLHCCALQDCTLNSMFLRLSWVLLLLKSSK